MKQLLLVLCIMMALSFSTTCSTETLETPEAAKQDTGKMIQGVWTLEYMDVGVGENKRTRDDAQFMMYIMEKHYSAIRPSYDSRISRPGIDDLQVFHGRRQYSYPGAAIRQNGHARNGEYQTFTGWENGLWRYGCTLCV
jgi:hypothetical protein